MYLVLIFLDDECLSLNSVCFFSKIKDVMTWSKGLIKYNDLNKIERVYKSYKTPIKLLEVHRTDELYYFYPMKKKYQKKLKSY
jgi:hypothetical protein